MLVVRPDLSVATKDNVWEQRMPYTEKGMGLHKHTEISRQQNRCYTTDCKDRTWVGLYKSGHMIPFKGIRCTVTVTPLLQSTQQQKGSWGHVEANVGVWFSWVSGRILWSACCPLKVAHKKIIDKSLISKSCTVPLSAAKSADIVPFPTGLSQ